ncbi:MAG: FAD-dependent oxidoreductase [Calditrichaceae bacterium]|jgi:NADPH-dependent 2,4-dienoyl-CoA reductase/sulfur reductase-like enzyme
MTSSYKHLIIIGGNAAGMSAASRARRHDADLKITVFEQSAHVSYASCGLPYYISNEVERPESLLAVKPDEFRKERKIDVKLKHQAVSFDPRSRTVQIKNLEDSSEFELIYDKLIIATGARAVMPDLPGKHLKNIFVLRTYDDGLIVKEYIDRNAPKKALIVGGGYVGMEMAESLRKRNIQVTLVDLSDHLMSGVDEEIAIKIEKHLFENECRIISSDKPVALLGNDSVEKVRFQREPEQSFDMVLFASGIKPNVEFALSGGVELGSTGAIAVNSKMQTNVMHVFAAGDCAEAKDLVTGKFKYVPLGTTANKQGRIAGDNVCGIHSHFKGITSTAAFKVFDLEIARCGVTEKRAKQLRLPYGKVNITAKTKAGYYPGAEPVTIMLIFNIDTGKLLGAQIAGYAGSAKRIDILAAALFNSMTVKDISELDLCYAPPFAPVWDPVLIAANQAVKQVRG